VQTVRIIGSVPGDDQPFYYISLEQAIRMAHRRIWLSTGYFVPPHQEREDLGKAARRGIDLRIVVPSQSDVEAAVYAGRAAYGDLLERGARIYEMQTAVLHCTRSSPPLMVCGPPWAHPTSTGAVSYSTTRSTPSSSAPIPLRRSRRCWATTWRSPGQSHCRPGTNVRCVSGYANWMPGSGNTGCSWLSRASGISGSKFPNHSAERPQGRGQLPGVAVVDCRQPIIDRRLRLHGGVLAELPCLNSRVISP
jgi:hypothetical protein